MSPDAPLTRRGLSRLIAAFTLAGAARARAQSAGPPYDVVLESNLRVSMRDGVKLATDV